MASLSCFMPILFNMELHAGPVWHFYIQEYASGNLCGYLTDYAGKKYCLHGTVSW